MSHSSEHLPLMETPPGKEEFKAFLSEPTDVGVLVDGAALSGLTTLLSGDKLAGLAWTHREIMVGLDLFYILVIILLLI